GRPWVTGKDRCARRSRAGLVGIGRRASPPALGGTPRAPGPAAAVAVAVEARLDGDHVAGDELAGSAPEARLLVHLEPDAVAERVGEAVLEHLARLLRAQRRVAVLLEDVAAEVVELAAGDAGADRR